MLDQLKARLDAETTVKCGWAGLTDPHYLRLLAGQGFDAVVLDMQHGFFDERAVTAGIMAVLGGGAAPIVRIPVQQWASVERVLDAGALGVIAPMVNTVEDARRFAQSAKFPTLGARSFGPRHAADLYGISVEDYLNRINGSSLALAMIETRQAFENIDDILAVEGIDGVFTGPSDFSISMTGNIIPDPFGEATVCEVEEVARRARAAGKIAGCFTFTPEQANLVHSFGYSLVSIGHDASYLEAGVKALTGDPGF